MYKVFAFILFLAFICLGIVTITNDVNHGPFQAYSVVNRGGREGNRRGPEKRPNGGREGNRGGDRRSHRQNGHIDRPAHIHLGPTPRNGWRGEPYRYEGYNYYVWEWNAWSPWYRWGNYEGWRIGLYYYVPEGMQCFADNPQVEGQWPGQDRYYSSDDAIDSALGACENDPKVYNARAEDYCRIRNCRKW